MNIKKKKEIFKLASIARNFELNVFEAVKNKKIKIPVYLSAGQEYISSTLANIIYQDLKIKPLIFPQHRCHSIYLSFGGDKRGLVNELLGLKNGCTETKGGSASIHSKKINLFGHDGHMGTQAPIGVGACFTSKKPTIIFMGDAAAEEDYVLGALGWASTKNLPILFIVEDNNLSILTQKKIRRNWHMHDVAKSFKMNGYEITDSPEEIAKYKNKFFKEPMLLNIKTNRLFWHSGAGQDDPKIFDRYKFEKNNLGSEGIKIENHFKKKIDNLWKQQLKTL
jgi:TPP-dependent pyruvate/acetoin dehydrogenase alpha subunit